MNTVKLMFVVRNLISSQLTMKFATDIQRPQRMNSHDVGDRLIHLLPPSAGPLDISFGFTHNLVQCRHS